LLAIGTEEWLQREEEEQQINTEGVYCLYTCAVHIYLSNMGLCAGVKEMLCPLSLLCYPLLHLGRGEGGMA